MIRLQIGAFMVLLFVTALFSVRTLQNSSAIRNYKWFQQKVAEQKKQNHKARKHNQYLRSQVMALQYDSRVIEQTARDHLSLTRAGEIIVILPQ